jgi:hypothetical protein
MTPQQANELPELPEPFGSIDIYEDEYTQRSIDGFTADQMRGYALDYWNRRAPAPTSEPGARDAVPTWQERMPAGYTDGGHDLPEEVAMKAEIADLRAALATPASPAVLPEDELDALMYPPKAMLKREDWNPVTRKPYPADPAPLVAQASPWISVDDRLPPRYEDVIVWPSPTEYVMTASYGLDRTGNLGWTYSEYVTAFGVEHHIMSKPPTHWMPFTAPEASPLVEDAQRIVAGKVEETKHIPPFAEPASQRFFMDHGVWHDRKTGQHMWTQDQYDEMQRQAYSDGVFEQMNNVAAKWAVVKATELNDKCKAVAAGRFRAQGGNTNDSTRNRATTGNAAADDGKDK